MECKVEFKGAGKGENASYHLEGWMARRVAQVVDDLVFQGHEYSEKVKVKLDAGAYCPWRAHLTDAGLDMYAKDSMVVPARGSATFDTGVHIEIPHGYAGFLKSKSGLNVKHGLISEGVVDEGYTGSVVVKLYNLSDEDYQIMAGDKISQLVLVKIGLQTVKIVDELAESERGDGGFGSTGRR